MKPTIQQVAQQAQVSISTVSRVINDHPAVLPETRQRVLDVIKALDYAPNQLARSLSSSGFDSILVIYTRSSADAIDNPYFSTVINAIGAVAERCRYDIILHSGSEEQSEIEKAQSLINSRLIKGIILLSSRIDSRFVSAMRDFSTPMVVVGQFDPAIKAPQIISVDTDNYTDSKEVGRYLAEMGHKKVGCLHAPLDHYVSVDRLRGFKAGLAEAGIELAEKRCLDGGHTVDTAYRASLDLLCSEKITAIFATDDIKALGVYKAAKTIGLRIPEDISVIGHNDYEVSTLLSPALTTIRVPIYDLGVVSASKLFSMIRGKKNVSGQMMPTELIVRDSVRSLLVPAVGSP